MPWTVLPNNSEILAVHVALLSNGKILIFPGDQHRGSATDFQHARLFNPATNLIEPCTAPTTDVFCSGHAFLGDGRIVVGGEDAARQPLGANRRHEFPAGAQRRRRSLVSNSGDAG